MAHIQTLLDGIGLEPARVKMFNMSAAMAGAFVTAATEMTTTVTDLGHNPLRNDRQPGPEQGE